MVSCRLRRGWHEFLQSPGRWTRVFVHDEVSRWLSPGRGAGVSCHDEVHWWRCKNHDTCALASSPIDFVSVAGVVMVPEI